MHMRVYIYEDIRKKCIRRFIVVISGDELT